MLKIGIEFKEVGETLNINLIDPTKKQLDSASENEKITAEIVKDVLNEKLLDLIGNYEQTKKEN